MTTDPDRIAAQIFELDAQYQGGVIKAANRAEFLKTYVVPLIKRALDEEYIKGIGYGITASRRETTPLWNDGNGR